LKINYSRSKVVFDDISTSHVERVIARIRTVQLQWLKTFMHMHAKGLIIKASILMSICKPIRLIKGIACLKGKVCVVSGICNPPIYAWNA